MTSVYREVQQLLVRSPQGWAKLHGQSCRQRAFSSSSPANPTPNSIPKPLSKAPPLVGATAPSAAAEAAASQCARRAAAAKAKVAAAEQVAAEGPISIAAVKRWWNTFKAVPAVPKVLGLTGAIPFIALAPPVAKHLDMFLPEVMCQNAAAWQVSHWAFSKTQEPALRSYVHEWKGIVKSLQVTICALSLLVFA